MEKKKVELYEFKSGEKVKFTTNINKKLLKEIKKVAIEKGFNVNDIVEAQLIKYLRKEAGKT